MPNPQHYQGMFGAYMARKAEQPPTPWQEYPKAIKLRDGSEVVALTQKAELQIIADDSSDKVIHHPAEARADELASKLGEASEERDNAKYVAAQLLAQNEELQAQMTQMLARLAALEAPPSADDVLAKALKGK